MIAPDIAPLVYALSHQRLCYAAAAAAAAATAPHLLCH
jgi:hypothetical protein